MNWRALTAPATKTLYPVHRLHGGLLLLLLLLTLLLGMGNSLHSRLLWVGEQTWPNYYLLNPDAKEPSCELEMDVEAEVARRIAAYKPDPDDLFSSPPDPQALRQSLQRNLALCQQAHAAYEQNMAHATTALALFKAVEQGLATFLLDNIELTKYLFIAMFAMAAAIAALDTDHIALRLPRNRAEWRLSQVAQFVVNGLMVLSLYAYLGKLAASPGSRGTMDLQYAWALVFGLFMVINVVRFVQVPERMRPGRLSLSSGLVVPLYCAMGLIAMGYFFLVDGYASGLAIYFGMMSNLSSMFINIGLYVLVGMVLKQTRLPELLLNVIKPYQLPAPMLASVIIFATAFPTAFTGASGIFILAVGGVVYDELRRAGAGRQLSLATTAMSGSLGVVLNPCLLIVVVAALNKEVTTTEMYGWGVWVFLMSATLFSVVVCKTEGNWRPRPAPGAVRASLAQLRPLLPYAAVAALVILAIWLLLGLRFNEYSAPLILPLVMLALVFLDSDQDRREQGQGRLQAFWRRSSAAASDSAVHIGALLALIGFSICLGGILERSDIVHALFPEHLDSPWLAMLVIVVMLTVIGMVMDPFGAVILVSATIAQPAIRMGIDPLHFWIVCLVAFELGYLSPPVALNHLLTRQVVGETEVLAAERTGSFWHRYERLLLPLAVMGPTLLLVAFVPMLFYAL
ncbi:TRAP transporter large permease subunit [Marinobacter lutaoensis]|jgi:TRAP-type C4-dicarboxylate transport system permease large subunit|uniref:C4-dicarboxylate ABC transporter n=1 Tax=Marinobacter lutaoensis TaxID=135739 RepID=A0A1V2DWY5_9GAMM|nr:TRAP transporter large permease subunit [Marinobacter lutaoensis]MBI42906.1 C4-dicarboxylate ABC transporter [Oceanospirillales bacterium]NVD34881.1 TRAP transporter large permease subunit [Marinobacter lutaoensis]ONF44916.1 C4-dicarboxylate ABC transporter [Marinobacter lutaoensis]|tara:strand:- start:12529 stop:14580 length:2052 start_codon:yes stop_codon:yes gene_type:complete